MKLDPKIELALTKEKLHRALATIKQHEQAAKIMEGAYACAMKSMEDLTKEIQDALRE